MAVVPETPELFTRIAERVNLPLLTTLRVVVVGVGTVGSQVARELAHCGVGLLRLIDHDFLDEANLIRHVLPRQYLHMNKAEGMTLYLAGEVPTLRPEAVPYKVDEHLSDDQLDRLLADADLIIAATDDRDVQRRIGRRALALDIPALFPGLYENSGGEVFLQRSPQHPCFFCWDGFRPVGQAVRGATALNADTLGIIQLTAHLSIGALDRSSRYARLFAASPQEPAPRQLFIQNEFALARQPIRKRPHCPACDVGPAAAQAGAPLNPDQLNGGSTEIVPVPDDDSVFDSLLRRVFSRDLLGFGLFGSIAVIATGLLSLVLPGASSLRHGDFFLVFGGPAATLDSLIQTVAIPAIVCGLALLALDVHLMQVGTSERLRSAVVLQAAAGGVGGLLSTIFLALVILNLAIWIAIFALLLAGICVLVAGLMSSA